MIVPQVLVVLAVVIGGACTLWPTMRWTPWAGLLAYLALASGMCAAPLMIPVELAWVRFLLCIPIAATVFKMYDLHRAAVRLPQDDPNHPSRFSVYARFLLAPPTVMTFRRWAVRDSLPVERPATRAIVLEGARAVAAGIGLYAAFQIDWLRYPFALEYLVKVSLVFVVIPAVTGVMTMLDRRRGVPACFAFDRIWSAATPAEFWRRFDTMFYDFAREHVFNRFGGRRRPVLGVLAVFLFSAVGHEALFTIALGRVEGYQLAFFTLNGVVVAATMRWRPKTTLARTLSRAATLTFVLASGTLFFASVAGVVPSFFVAR